MISKNKTNFMKSILTSLIFTLSCVALSGQENILPISLKNFTVNKLKDATVEVEWDIIHQNSASGYSIEHSLDSKTWQPVGFVPSVANDNYKTFKYTHTNPRSGLNYYRIHFKDKNEKHNYSEVKIVSLKTSANVSLWPNPSHDFLHIQGNFSKDAYTKAVIFSGIGVKLNEVDLVPGVNKIPIYKLTPGTYYIQLNGVSQERLSLQFIKA